MNAERIRVLLVTSTGLFGEGLHSRLERERDLDLLGVATSSAAAITIAQQHHPAVVVLDATLDNQRGIATIEGIRRMLPDIQVVVLAPDADLQRTVQAACAGALSYLLTTSPSALLLDAIRAAVHGIRCIDPAVGSTLFHQCATPISTDTSAQSAVSLGLTPRELEVWYLVRQGQNNRAIARRLCISENTVKSHRTHVRQKTGGTE